MGGACKSIWSERMTNTLGEGGVGMSAWMRNPYLADMMAKRPKPKFSGFDADWRDFARAWEDFQLSLEQACLGEVPNFSPFGDAT